jgi:glycosyltransferase involved in cell wall biosynthesis
MTKKILIVIDAYRPGFRGGAIQAVANLVDRLGGRYDFWIITRDRDFHHDRPHDGIVPNVWQRVGHARVQYVSPDRIGFARLAALTREAAPDMVALTSVFSALAVRMLLLRRTGALPAAVPWLVAPQGEFSTGALRQKRWKKGPFLPLARSFGLYRHVTWQAGSSLECDDIRRVMPSAERIALAPLLPPVGSRVESRPPAPLAKRPGQATFLYLSKVTPKKNLRFALEILRGVRGEIALDVIGFVDDRAYWDSCLQMARTACPHVQLRHAGEVPHEAVMDEMARRHFLILPTLGENFGYTILEALASGRPAVISDRTPWRNLPAHDAGWDLPLDDHQAWRRVLDECVAMDATRYQTLVQGAWKHAIRYADAPTLENATADLFDEVLTR